MVQKSNFQEQKSEIKLHTVETVEQDFEQLQSEFQSSLTDLSKQISESTTVIQKSHSDYLTLINAFENLQNKIKKIENELESLLIAYQDKYNQVLIKHENSISQSEQKLGVIQTQYQDSFEKAELQICEIKKQYLLIITDIQSKLTAYSKKYEDILDSLKKEYIQKYNEVVQKTLQTSNSAKDEFDGFQEKILDNLSLLKEQYQSTVEQIRGDLFSHVDSKIDLLSKKNKVAFLGLKNDYQNGYQALLEKTEESYIQLLNKADKKIEDNYKFYQDQYNQFVQENTGLLQMNLQKNNEESYQGVQEFKNSADRFQKIQREYSENIKQLDNAINEKTDQYKKLISKIKITLNLLAVLCIITLSGAVIIAQKIDWASLFNR